MIPGAFVGKKIAVRVQSSFIPEEDAPALSAIPEITPSTSGNFSAEGIRFWYVTDGYVVYQCFIDAVLVEIQA